MKPKMYRKKKASKPSDMATFKNNAGGGPMKFVDGPESSVGQKEGKTISKIHMETGDK